jgi:RNA polymerase sigma factor (sigma-70 family)
MNDHENVLDALNGDKQAYGRLVDSYQGVVFAVALNITGNYSDSQDVVQEVFITAYRKLRTLSKPSNFNKWLYVITKRASYSFLRKKKRTPNNTVEEIDIAKIKADALTAAQEYAHKEFNALVWKQVHELPRKSREAILLYYMEGFSIKKAAAFLNITESSMQSRLKIARQRIRENLDEKLEAELRHHRPSQKTRNYILAALPAGAVPKIGPFASLATKGTLTMATLTTKKAAIIATAIIIGTISTITIINRPPQTSPIVPPVVEDEKEVAAKNDPQITQETIQTDLSDTVAVKETLSGDTETQVESSISGYVYYADTKEPVPGAYVIIYQGSVEYKTVVSNNRGQYHVLFPAGVPVAEIYARKGDDASNAITSLLVEKNESLNDVDFFLEPGAEVSGTLKNKQTRKPVPGRKVNISKVTNPYGQHGTIIGRTYVSCNLESTLKSLFFRPLV